MKPVFKIALIFVTLTPCSLAVKAQDKEISTKTFNDYVITIKGDTVPCQVNIPIFGDHNYQSALMSKTKRIKRDEIKEYYSSKKRFLFRLMTLEGDKKPFFLPVILNGKISLYQKPYTQYTTIWYISKGTDTAYLLKTNDISLTRKDRQSRFEDMIKDNAAVYEKFLAAKKFTYNELLNIIYEYNTGTPYN